MAFTTPSTTRSTTPSTGPAIDANSVNTITGYPTGVRWTPAVNPAQYTDEGPEFAIEGPPAGDWVLSDIQPGSLPAQAAGGGYQDTSWTTGTDGPTVPWDSMAGAPFAPSCAVNPELHAQDTGAVYQAEHVTPAAIGSLIRRTGIGQTWNREYTFDDVNGQYVPGTNGRQNLDTQQNWNPNPYDDHTPWQFTSSERPIYNNLARTAAPVDSFPGIYGISGALPNRAPYQDYQASVYQSPPDPSVAQPSAANDGGWPSW